MDEWTYAGWTVRRATPADVRTFAAWTYEPPYDIYNMLDNEDREAELEDALAYFLTTAVQCHVLVGEAGDVCAFCTFGEDGQVPGGDYRAPALDIGLGVRPDLTGQGLGQEFVTAVSHFARKRFQPEALRVTIAAFNVRAQRVWARQGFVIQQQFTATVGEKRPFLIMTKEMTG